MSPAKSRTLQRRLLDALVCERGIDDDHDHHIVLIRLRLLDDDDNYALFMQMRDEDEEFGFSPNLEHRVSTLTRLSTPTDADGGTVLKRERRGILAEATKEEQESNKVTDSKAMKIDINAEAHMVLSDAFLEDARGPIQSDRHRWDCAFDSGYHALLAVLSEAERPREDHPRVESVQVACGRLELDAKAGVLRAQQRYSADERDDLDAVLAWAETVRVRAKQHLQMK